jgi:DNA-binding HxlR family transcriptional regulator
MTCTVARTVAIVGDSWTQMILREMFLGSRRFDDLQRYTGVSPHLLSQRLKRLEAAQIVRRYAYSDRPPRHEYQLTEKGRDLWPVILALKAWGDRWLTGVRESPIALTHVTCGQETRPYVVCSACGDPIEARTARAALSPKMARERAIATRLTKGRGQT